MNHPDEPFSFSKVMLTRSWADDVDDMPDSEYVPTPPASLPVTSKPKPKPIPKTIVTAYRPEQGWNTVKKKEKSVPPPKQSTNDIGSRALFLVGTQGYDTLPALGKWLVEEMALPILDMQFAFKQGEQMPYVFAIFSDKAVCAELVESTRTIFNPHENSTVQIRTIEPTPRDDQDPYTVMLKGPFFTVTDVKGILKHLGEPQNIRVDRSGKVAFVTYDNKIAPFLAFKMYNGLNWGGRNLIVSLATQRR